MLVRQKHEDMEDDKMEVRLGYYLKRNKIEEVENCMRNRIEEVDYEMVEEGKIEEVDCEMDKVEEEDYEEGKTEEEDYEKDRLMMMLADGGRNDLMKEEKMVVR